MATRRSKRMYEKDGRATPDGNTFAYKVKLFMEALVEEANKKKLDLRDLEAIVFDEIAVPIHRRIIQNRREDNPEDYVGFQK